MCLPFYFGLYWVKWEVGFTTPVTQKGPQTLKLQLIFVLFVWLAGWFFVFVYVINTIGPAGKERTYNTGEVNQPTLP